MFENFRTSTVQNKKKTHTYTVRYPDILSEMGDLRLSGSIVQKSRFIFTKEQRNRRQKSRCLNERFYQVNIQMQG